jgi:hypothetical protein
MAALPLSPQCSRRGAVGILKHGGTLGHFGLLSVVVGHRAAGTGKKSLDLRQAPLVHHHPAAKRAATVSFVRSS